MVSSRTKRVLALLQLLFNPHNNMQSMVLKNRDHPQAVVRVPSGCFSSPMTTTGVQFPTEFTDTIFFIGPRTMLQSSYLSTHNNRISMPFDSINRVYDLAVVQTS